MEMTQGLLKRVDLWVEEHIDQLVEDTCKLIRIPSVSDKTSDVKPFGPGCRDVLNAYIEIGESYGLKSKNFDGYVAELYVPETQGKPKRIGLMGHLDVVPEGENWLYPPYEGIVKGNWIIGRGSQDNKGPCLAAMYTVLCLRDLNIDLEYDVCALAGTDEESGMADAEYYAKLPDLPDLIIVTDSGFPICYGERGIASGWLRSREKLSDNILLFQGGTATNQIPDQASITLRATPSVLEKAIKTDSITLSQKEDTLVITAHGKAGHIATAQNAVNAIGVLMKYLLKYDLLENHSDRIIFQQAESMVNSPCGKIFQLSQNEALANDVRYGCGIAKTEDGFLKFSFNSRCPVALNEGDALQKIQEYAAANGFAAEETRVLPSNYFPKDRPVIQILHQVFGEITGLHLEPQIFTAGTHARKLPNAVAFGPGIPDQSYYRDEEGLFPDGHGSCHMPDEAQSIPALKEALRIYIRGVIALDGQDLSKEE